MSLPSIHGRDLPPTDEALDAWVDKHDTPKNRKALAAYMADSAVCDCEPFFDDDEGLVGRILDWLDGQPSEAVVAAMASVYACVDGAAHYRRERGARDEAAAMLAAWDGPVPTYDDFANPGDPNEGDPPEPEDDER